MERCHSCNEPIMFGAIKKEQHVFCSKDCAEDFEASIRGFCPSCMADTTEESSGDMELFNNVGTGWGPFSRNRCSNCGSVIKTKWIYFLVPIIPKGKYRVLYTKRVGGVLPTKTQFLSRKIKAGNTPAPR